MPQAGYEVADAIVIAEKLRVRVDWIDKVFEEIEKKKKHYELVSQYQIWET